MKKINAVISWLVIIMLLVHIGLMVPLLITGNANFAVTKVVSVITAILVVAHGVLSMLNVYLFNRGSRTGYYRKNNAKTIIQRVTAFLMIGFFLFHINAFNFVVDGVAMSAALQIVLLITEISFFASIMLHIAVSFSKSLITLGLIRTDSAEKLINRIVAIICSVVWGIATFAVIYFVYWYDVVPVG